MKPLVITSLLVGFFIFWLPPLATGTQGFFIYDLLGYQLYQTNPLASSLLSYLLCVFIPSLIISLIFKKLNLVNGMSKVKTFWIAFAGINLALLSYLLFLMYLVYQSNFGF